MWEIASLGSDPSKVMKFGRSNAAGNADLTPVAIAAVGSGSSANSAGADLLQPLMSGLLAAPSNAADAPAVAPVGQDDPNFPKGPPYKYTSPTISSYAISASAMAKLDFGSLGGGEGSSEAFFFVCEVAAFTDDVYIARAADESLLLNKYGIGFRIGIKAWGLESKMTANLGMVAAAAELNVAQTQMEVQVFAGDVKRFSAVTDAVKLLTTKFSAETLKNIAGVVSILTDVVSKDGATIPPVLVKYGEFKPNLYTPDRIVISNSYALESLGRGNSRQNLDAWLAHDAGRKKWVKEIGPQIVQCAYENLGFANSNSVPTDAERTELWRLRNLGA